MFVKPTATVRTRRRIIHSSVLIAFVLLAAALAGCGALNVGGAKATATPDAATILQRASTASYKDATFTLTLSTLISGTTTTGTGSGALTKLPERAKLTLIIPFTLAGTTNTVTFDIVVDKATDSTYTRITGLPVGSDKWTKTTTSSDVSGSPVNVSSLIDVDKLKDAKLIGVETVDGVKVYHAQATGSTTTTTAGSTPTTSDSTTDIYVRTDNYRVQKISSHITGDTASDVSLTFTAYDTGVTIDLPQV